MPSSLIFGQTGIQYPTRWCLASACHPAGAVLSCAVIPACQWSCASFSSPELGCQPSMREINFCLQCLPTRYVLCWNFPWREERQSPKKEGLGKRKRPSVFIRASLQMSPWYVNAENAYAACKIILVTGSTSGSSQTWPKMFSAWTGTSNFPGPVSLYV